MDAHQLGIQIMASHDPGQRAMAMSSLIMELLVEVQALREAVAEVPAAKAAYRAAYERVCVLSHNSAGVTPGEVKVLQQFLNGREGTWLGRLGASADEVAAFEKECRKVETYT